MITRTASRPGRRAYPPPRRGQKPLPLGVALLVAATGSACAFTTTDVVIVEGAPLYEANRCGDEGALVVYLSYWQPVKAEPVGTPESPRTYAHVTLKDGREGEVEWNDLGRIWVVTKDDAPVYASPDEGSRVLARLNQGDWVAEVRVAHPELRGLWREVLTPGGVRGWIPDELIAAAE